MKPTKHLEKGEGGNGYIMEGVSMFKTHMYGIYHNEIPLC
jgi:hypothetical protein